MCINIQTHTYTHTYIYIYSGPGIPAGGFPAQTRCHLKGERQLQVLPGQWAGPAFGIPKWDIPMAIAYHFRRIAERCHRKLRKQKKACSASQCVGWLGLVGRWLGMLQTTNQGLPVIQKWDMSMTMVYHVHLGCCNDPSAKSESLFVGSM